MGPQENGYVESFIGKLRDESLNREVFTTLEEAKTLLNQCRREYNQVRPRSALGYRPPAPEAVAVRILAWKVNQIMGVGHLFPEKTTK